MIRPTVPVQIEIGAVEEETAHEEKIIRPLQHQGVESGIAGRNQMVMVNRHQDADHIVDQHRQEDLAVENNLTTIVERIMARNDMSATLQRPLYVSPLAEFILQAEAPRGMKVPKYIKFGGESGESTIEHVTRYLIESEDLAHNECLRVKNFPFSLTKVAFTWFTSLAPSSIDSWAKLEKKFHEQFYEGHSKINLAELSNIKRRDLVQKAIQEGMLKFAGRRMKIDTDPLHQEEALFVEPVEINMVEISKYDEANMLEKIGESPDVNS
ncbi:uncharacterized protein LOC127137365 [Lathyrus oleraceus]|uniref:uncharacterized protein LOC127137365 n=1 Tax=Pisum sativum TaxID=3888 RepID=UPI0021D0D88F|nr:uncharacterized protein LOC127137365 [Pisum sativum]